MTTENQNNGTPAGAPENTAPTSPAPGGDAPGTDVKALLDYDPFEKPQVPAAAPGASPGAPAPGQPAPVQPGTPTSPPEVSAQPLNEARINELVEARLAQFAAQRAEPQPGPSGAPAQPNAQPGQPAQPERNYGFQVAPELFQGLNSEDVNVRNQSLVHLMNGVAETIHQTVLQRVNSMFEQYSQHVPQQTQEQIAAVARHQEVHNDFYGTFPALNKPHFLPMVAQIAAQVQQRMGAVGWSPALRDEIGREVFKALGWQLPAAPAPGQPAIRPQPPAQTNPTSRPAAPGPAMSTQDEIADFVFGR